MVPGITSALREDDTGELTVTHYLDVAQLALRLIRGPSPQPGSLVVIRSDVSTLLWGRPITSRST